jgi:hypothetical protein
MVTFSQQAYMIWRFVVSESWFLTNYSVWYCIQWFDKYWTCKNNCLWTLIIQQSVHLVGPKDDNIQSEGTAYCHVSKHLHWIELEGNTCLEWMVTCDEMWMHYHSPELESVQNGIVSQRISTTQNFKTQLSAGKCALVFRRNDICWFSSTWCNN